MKKRPELILLVGNIGTGKTTLTKKYVKKGYIVIARDALRYGIGGGKYIFNPKLESAIWITEFDMILNFLNIRANIILDSAYITKIMRKKIIQHVKAFRGYQIIAIELPRLSKKEAVDRRMRAPHGTPDRKVWEDAWDKFNRIYQSPTKQEGFDKVIRKKS